MQVYFTNKCVFIFPGNGSITNFLTEKIISFPAILGTDLLTYTYSLPQDFQLYINVHPYIHIHGCMYCMNK